MKLVILIVSCESDVVQVLAASVVAAGVGGYGSTHTEQIKQI